MTGRAMGEARGRGAGWRRPWFRLRGERRRVGRGAAMRQSVTFGAWPETLQGGRSLRKATNGCFRPIADIRASIPSALPPREQALMLARPRQLSDQADASSMRSRGLPMSSPSR